MRLKFKFITFFIFPILFLSCATTINYSAKRPAQLDLNGASSISVLPFKTEATQYYSDYSGKRNIIDFFIKILNESTYETETVNYIKSYLEKEISSADYYKLISSNLIEDDIINKRNQNLPDIYLTGEIIIFNVNDERIIETKIDNDKKNHSGPKPVKGDNGFEDKIPPDKEETIKEEKFKRNVKFNFVYEIIDSSTEQIISYKVVKINDSSSEYSNPQSLPNPLSIIKYDLNKSLKQIIKEIQPYYENKKLKLLNNKNYKDEFNNAKKLLKNSNFEEGKQIYLNLYKENNVLEAGYNAALILEVQGKLQDSKELMQEINKKAQTTSLLKKTDNALIDIQNEINYKIRLNEQNINRKERDEN